MTTHKNLEHYERKFDFANKEEIPAEVTKQFRVAVESMERYMGTATAFSISLLVPPTPEEAAERPDEQLARLVLVQGGSPRDIMEMTAHAQQHAEETAAAEIKEKLKSVVGPIIDAILARQREAEAAGDPFSKDDLMGILRGQLRPGFKES